MRSRTNLSITSFAIALTVSPSAFAASPERAEFGAPYFMIETGELDEDAPVDLLPLKDSRAEITISGVIAHAHLTQTYENDGKTTVEATYVFPGPTRAAIFAMRMTIGTRTIRAEIQPRQTARATYETAKSEGRAASLLQQERPNVMTMRVANIRPRDRVVVEIDYSELLVPRDGVYELVYPGIVGPRYSRNWVDWAQNPYSGEKSKRPKYGWDVDIHIDAGMPIREISSPSHRVHAIFRGEDQVDVVVDGTDRRGDRDFVLRYRLGGDRIQAGLLLSPPDIRGEQFFLLMVQPPKSVAPVDSPPREYIFVLDVSGSMSGYPLATAKELMRELLGRLGPEDRFNILQFAGGSRVHYPESVPATPAEIRRALDETENAGAGGITEIEAALERAISLPRASDEMSRTVVVITDGFVTAEPEVFELVRKSLFAANVFAFGIGENVNRHLIEGIARAGAGEPAVVLDRREAKEKGEAFARMIASPLMTRAGVTFEGFDVYDVEPQTQPDLFADRPLVVFGKYRGKPSGTIRVSGTTPAGPFERTLEARAYKGSRQTNALRYLWARHKVASLADADAIKPEGARMKIIEELGMKYALLTAATSFVAVDVADRSPRAEAALETGATIKPALGRSVGGAEAEQKRDEAIESLSKLLPNFGKKTIIDFSDVETQGQLVRPEGSYLLERKRTGTPAAWSEALLGSVRARGALSLEAVRAVIVARRAALLACRDLASPSSASIEVELAIDGAGVVRSVRFLATDLDDTSRKLIEAAILRWRFPSDPGGTTFVVASFELDAGGRTPARPDPGARPDGPK